jgi:hypothetical protein
MRLELIVEKNLPKRKKMDIIPVFLNPSEVRDGAINFIYNLSNNISNDVAFSMRLTIDKLKINYSLNQRLPEAENHVPSKTKKKGKIFGFLYRSNSSTLSQKSASSLSEGDVDNEKESSGLDNDSLSVDSPVNRAINKRLIKKGFSNKVIAIKDNYINELMRQEAKFGKVEINFEHLESIYIRKKLHFLQQNLVVRFLSRYIYKQHYSKSKQGHLPFLIFFFLTIEIVSFFLE